MKIDVNKIPAEGLILAEELNPKRLDLETDIIKFCSGVNIRAEVSRITNAVTVILSVDGILHLSCSRCLEEFDSALKKKITLNFQVENSQTHIDLDPEIREEIILDYPLKPLCKLGCKGLCPQCGANLNEGGCTCGTT
ncbi:MAG: hypothetical protein A3K83_06930 [Omnitrophica WOR_2 bacterium RBG_13_44_8b]|nr:MAG: hypothetical protein A3K83_06930 [Omnitrophica WOR_2 bacterium RBG_13_44_8b]